MKGGAYKFVLFFREYHLLSRYIYSGFASGCRKTATYTFSFGPIFIVKKKKCLIMPDNETLYRFYKESTWKEKVNEKVYIFVQVFY